MKPYQLIDLFEALDPDFELLDKLYQHEQKEYLQRRLRVIRLLWEGHTRREVCEMCKISNRSLISWVKVIAENGVAKGLEQLATGKKSSRSGKLSPSQQAEVIRIVQEEHPANYGYTENVFMGRILVDLIKKKWDVELSDQAVYNLLRKKGLSYQKAPQDHGAGDGVTQAEFKKWVLNG